MTWTDQLWFVLGVVWVCLLLLTPTLCYYGLWRLLEALRDDELIDRIATVHGDGRASRPAPVDVLADDESLVTCPDCGTANKGSVRYCYSCLSRLPPESSDDR